MRKKGANMERDRSEACQAYGLARGLEGDAARIPMTDEAVLALLRRHFTGVDSMYLCPNVPGKKEIVARGVHARNLPSDERVLALFDETLFGDGDEGFLVTSRRLCWKNPGLTCRPQMLEWQHLDPDAMYADRRKLVLGAGAIETSGDESALEAFEAAFHVLAFSARAPAPHRAHQVARKISDRPTFRPSHAPPPLESEVVPRSDRKPPIANANANAAKETAPPPHAVTYASYVLALPHAASLEHAPVRALRRAAEPAGLAT
jgi:hypothetical protein